jgi:hypothetical protein
VKKKGPKLEDWKTQKPNWKSKTETKSYFYFLFICFFGVMTHEGDQRLQSEQNSITGNEVGSSRQPMFRYGSS